MVSTHSKTPTNGKMGVMTTSAWETILDGGNFNDANRNRERLGEQKVEPVPAPEDDNDSIATALAEVIAD